MWQQKVHEASLTPKAPENHGGEGQLQPEPVCDDPEQNMNRLQEWRDNQSQYVRLAENKFMVRRGTWEISGTEKEWVEREPWLETEREVSSAVRTSEGLVYFSVHVVEQAAGGVAAADLWGGDGAA
jgi:hypothetical protein